MCYQVAESRYLVFQSEAETVSRNNFSVSRNIVDRQELYTQTPRTTHEQKKGGKNTKAFSKILAKAMVNAVTACNLMFEKCAELADSCSLFEPCI